MQLHVFRELDEANRDSLLLLERLHHVKGCLVYLEYFASRNSRFLRAHFFKQLLYFFVVHPSARLVQIWRRDQGVVKVSE